MELDARQLTVKQARIALAGLVVMIVVGVGNIYFSYQNHKQNADLQVERERFHKESQMTRQMLDSRARIQLILIDAAKSGRPLTLDEVRAIDRLFVPAEYNLVEAR